MHIVIICYFLKLKTIFFYVIRKKNNTIEHRTIIKMRI